MYSTVNLSQFNELLMTFNLHVILKLLCNILALVRVCTILESYSLWFQELQNPKTSCRFCKTFVSHLLECSRAIHQLFQGGKILSHAIEMAKTNDKLVLKVTSGTCSTRFASSQYVKFQKLVDLLPLFIKTF